MRLFDRNAVVTRSMDHQKRGHVLVNVTDTSRIFQDLATFVGLDFGEPEKCCHATRNTSTARFLLRVAVHRTRVLGNAQFKIVLAKERK